MNNTYDFESITFNTSKGEFALVTTMLQGKKLNVMVDFDCVDKWYILPTDTQPELHDVSIKFVDQLKNYLTAKYPEQMKMRLAKYKFTHEESEVKGVITVYCYLCDKFINKVIIDMTRDIHRYDFEYKDTSHTKEFNDALFNYLKKEFPNNF